MTSFEQISIILLWIITGVFICHKARWFEDNGQEGSCIATIMFAPFVFILDIFNRVFIQKWH